jgi:hypothetical protein
MRRYDLNSNEAVCRLLALSLVSDGGIDQSESHRVSRRLQFLREWRHEEINSLFPRSP